MTPDHLADVTRLACAGMVIFVAVRDFMKRRRAWVWLMGMSAAVEIVGQVAVMLVRDKVTSTVVQTYYVALTGALAMNVGLVLTFLGLTLAAVHFVRISRSRRESSPRSNRWR